MKQIIFLFTILTLAVISHCEKAFAADVPAPSWIRTFNAKGLENYPAGAVTDANGNVYVAGWTTIGTGNTFYCVINYDASGNLISFDTLDKNIYDGNFATSIAISGNAIYVTGRGKTTGATWFKSVTMKWKINASTFVLTKETGGGTSWPAVVDDGINEHFQGSVVKVGTDGYLYIGLNRGYNSTSLSQFGIEKIDTNNGTTSTSMINPQTNSIDSVCDMVLDGSNNVYLLAVSDHSGRKARIYKYNHGTSMKWIDSIATVGNVSRIRIDKDSNVYVYYSESGGTNKVQIYSNTGSTHAALTTLATGSGDAADDSYDMNVTKNKNVYIGWRNGTNNHLVKFSNTGTSTWNTSPTWNITTASNTYTEFTTVDTSETYIYSAATLTTTIGFGLFRYNCSDGSGFSYTDFDMFNYPISAGLSDMARVITTTTDGKIFVVGATFGDYFTTLASSFVIQVGKFDIGGGFPAQMGAKQLISTAKVAPEEFELSQNFPNPFNPTTTIKFFLPEDATISLKIYNTTGQEVKNLFENKDYEMGDHEISFDASNLSSGVYFYHVTASNGKFNDVKKMVLMK